MLITVICMELYSTSLTRPTPQKIPTKYYFLILGGDNTVFFFPSLVIVVSILCIVYFLFYIFIIFMKTLLIFHVLICFLFRVLLTALLVAKWGLYPSKKFLLLTGLLGSPMLHPCRWMSSWLVSLRSCPLPLFVSIICFWEEGMIHFFYRSHAKKPESGLFSDWIGNNADDLRCSDWPKRRHPLVVVDFSLHFCLPNEQWIHTHASSLWNFCRLSFLESEKSLNRNLIHWNIFHFIVT